MLGTDLGLSWLRNTGAARAIPRLPTHLSARQTPPPLAAWAARPPRRPRQPRLPLSPRRTAAARPSAAPTARPRWPAMHGFEANPIALARGMPRPPFATRWGQPKWLTERRQHSSRAREQTTCTPGMRKHRLGQPLRQASGPGPCLQLWREAVAQEHLRHLVPADLQAQKQAAGQQTDKTSYTSAGSKASLRQFS